MKFRKNLLQLFVILATLGIGLVFFWKKEKPVIKFASRKIGNTPIKTPCLSFAHYRRRHKPRSFMDIFGDVKALFFILPIGIATFVLSEFFNDYSYLFRASIVELSPTEFSGTVQPIEKVPDWVKLTDRERKMNFAQIPQSKLIALPEYKVSDFVAGKEWGKGSDHQRNAYITYPVPNLGDYSLDGTENSGSHTGIDIKTPVGTPVRAVSNGAVFRVGNQPTGFGKFITIAHVGIPDPQRPNKKTTLFSNYAHLSSVDVREGSRIKKGDIIGKTGNSGMTTSPHLHFQIDRDTAPFHPYWPFLWKDVKAAGLNSYFEAVKSGVGKSDAEKHTTHPVGFIAQFQNYIAPNLVASVQTARLEDVADAKQSDPDVVVDLDNASLVEKSDAAANRVREQDIAISQDADYEREKLKVSFETDRVFIPGNDKVIKIRVNEADLIATNGIEIGPTDRRAAVVTPSKLYSQDFVRNVAEVRVRSSEDRIFKLIASGDFGAVKSGSLRPQVFSDVSPSHTYAAAIRFLKENNIVNGYGDGTFKPDNTINRAEAVKILLTGNNIVAINGKKSFPDVPATAWFAPYVTTAADLGIIRGYGDGNFRPDNTISRAEFIKVAILTAEFEVGDVTRMPYPDVALDAWFAPYFQFARDNNLLRMKKGGFIAPNSPISRAEAADVIYKLDRAR